MSTTRHHPDAEVIIGPKTFAEKHGRAFDWHKALANPPRTESPAHRELICRSRSWVSCATGNQCEIIPRLGHRERLVPGMDDFYYEEGTPKDDELRTLGGAFHGLILQGEWVGARKLLRKIEARSAELISELTQ